jgi:hypothetical protein
MTRATIRKPLPIILGCLCFIVALGVPLLPGEGVSDLWPVFLWFGLGGCVFIYLAFPKTPEFEIGAQHVSIRGIKFQARNIVSGRVFRANYDGSRERYLQLEFRTMPRLSIMWRVTKFLMGRGFPLKCDQGIPLALEPQIIIPLNSTDMSDVDLNKALTIMLSEGEGVS